VEADYSGAASMVGGPRNGGSARALHQRAARTHDACWLRVRIGEARSHRESALSLLGDQARLSSRTEACALTVLEATKDLRKVSLWLGHASMQTTEMYTRADPSIKLEALDAVTPPKLRSGRFRASDKLIASLTARSVMRREKRSK
jgi:hypothetical protein